MRIRIEEDNTLKEPEVIIRAPAGDSRVHAIQAQLQAHDAPAALPVFQGSTETFVALSEVLFIETAGRLLQVHTREQLFTTNEKLYVLAASLPAEFLQVAKSSIVNLTQISGFNRSVSNCLVTFRDSHKTVYASRRYYKELVARLNEMRGY
ncbi:LytTR family DNA-binding domain-containing protein [Lacticaseibacillus yichunensis]|uniref:LytTR family DNA-binding domain-containing protein n=1 Tax=Lacticaseibacillus yichunensis TaxID=2486015 RepID=A0ABW4CPA7_9LACO|nr:LytTR family DNA-binding domain-containing protein [Lacticaseibacillus yichunensis]